VHRRVLHDILGFAAEHDLPPHGITRSPVTGAAGNVEFLAWLGGNGPDLPLDSSVEQLVTQGPVGDERA
jgi:23S rRNA (cytidine1920-2'-O)/16S rRNA (cytidine1409-2'-O)-methyltransferase